MVTFFLYLEDEVKISGGGLINTLVGNASTYMKKGPLVRSKHESEVNTLGRKFGHKSTRFAREALATPIRFLT